MKKIAYVFYFLTTFSIFAQKEANFWYFGNNAGVDFSSGSPVALSNGKLKTNEGCSSISDKEGNLLFYSDGTSVYTKNHELMKYANGKLANNLEGNSSSTQSGLIVPNPEDKNLYYIFTVGTNFVGSNTGLSENPGFNFYTVDISKGNGGEIIAGPVNLSKGKDFDWSEKVTAVEAKNCKEIWILSVVRDEFYAYKVDKNGVNLTPVISKQPFSLNDKRGYLKVSPNGSKIAVADYNADFNDEEKSFELRNSQLILFDFNYATGVVSNPINGLINLTNDGAPYGVEFSRQSTKLYISTYDGSSNSVFQFDLTSTNIRNSKTFIHKKQGYRGALQLAPDGKIYATVPVSYLEHTQFLDVIENIDDEPSKVKYLSNAIKLNGLSTQGLPPFIQSFFAPVNLVNIETNEIFRSVNQYFCIGESYTIQPQINDSKAKYVWFQDGKEIANSKTLTITNEKYGSGLYEVKVESQSECKKTFTGKIKVSFVPKAIINKIQPYIQCDVDANSFDGFTSFNLTHKESELVNENKNILIEFFEVSDTSFSFPLNKNNYTNAVANSHTLVVKATNTLTKCYQTETIELQVNAASLTIYEDEHIWELDENISNTDAKLSLGTSKGSFNFSKKTQKIVANSGNTLSLSTHNIQYYRTAEDASLQINEIKAPYNDDLFINEAEVFVRISNKSTNACESVGKFKIFVEELPVPKGDANERILCMNSSKGSLQTNSIALNATTGNPSDTYKWYLNGVEISGETSAVYQATSGGQYKVEAYRSHPNIKTNSIGYNTFSVKTSNVATVVNVRAFDNEDNPKNNKIEITVKGIGDYEYALNSSNISDFTKGSENLTYTFSNILPGLNRIYIRDRNECGVVATEEISIIYFQRHFSPNEDGKFDTWNVLGVNNDSFKKINVSIFDRYGKILHKITNNNSLGWDGFFNGSRLPQSDYWYSAELIDKKGKVIKKKGHFSLIR